MPVSEERSGHAAVVRPAARPAATLAEALAMIEAIGLDRDAAFSVLANGAPGSPLVKTVGPRMLARDYDVNFALSLMRKDLVYAIDEAAAHGVTLSIAATARSLYEKAIGAGLAAPTSPPSSNRSGPQTGTDE